MKSELRALSSRDEVLQESAIRGEFQELIVAVLNKDRPVGGDVGVNRTAEKEVPSFFPDPQPFFELQGASEIPFLGNGRVADDLDSVLDPDLFSSGWRTTAPQDRENKRIATVCWSPSIPHVDRLSARCPHEYAEADRSSALGNDLAESRAGARRSGRLRRVRGPCEGLPMQAASQAADISGQKFQDECG
jgi:hypothetical protein